MRKAFIYERVCVRRAGIRYEIKIVRDACTQFNNFGKQIDNYCRVLGDIAENYKRAEQENEQIAARK